MTWTAVLVLVVAIIIKMLMSPPSAVVGWITGKFALHQKLNPNNITVSYDGHLLNDNEKLNFTNEFNNALFLDRNHIFPGTEDLFLHPETEIIPFVINSKSKNKEITHFVYCNEEQVNVVKQWKKKVTFYNLSSSNLQGGNISYTS